MDLKEADCVVCPFTEETKCSDCDTNWNNKSISKQHKEFVLDRFSKVQ